MIKHIGAIKLPVNRLHLELTNICNFSCEFCPDSKMKRQRGMMSVELAKSVIDEVSRIGAAKLVLFHVMGEPTLHPGLLDIIEYADRRNVKTCLTTNGSRLDERFFNEIIHAGVGEIIISLQTPDEKTFSLRGAKGIAFDEYAERITTIAKSFLFNAGKARLTINFLSSPLRRLIIPIFSEVSIADTSADLKKYLEIWAKRIIINTPFEGIYKEAQKQIKNIWTFRENTIRITDRFNFHTRIMGDWAIHFNGKNINAAFGYCPGIQDNFGILWNGDYTFCCTDFDGNTSLHNYRDTSIHDYLNKEAIQKVVKGFQSFRVVHPYCKQCLGDKNILNAIVKQIGSLVYFRWWNKRRYLS
ncbi:MAG: radical SAM/SPASM domain-containing protein [Nitrospirota bacterium]